MVDRGLSRPTIAKHLHRIGHMFGWRVTRRLVPEAVTGVLRYAKAPRPAKHPRKLWRSNRSGPCSIGRIEQHHRFANERGEPAEARGDPSLHPLGAKSHVRRIAPITPSAEVEARLVGLKYACHHAKTATGFDHTRELIELGSGGESARRFYCTQSPYVGAGARPRQLRSKGDSPTSCSRTPLASSRGWVGAHCRHQVRGLAPARAE